MKKVLFVVALSSMVLSGCGYKEGEHIENGRFKVVDKTGSYDILRDTKTGCMYFYEDVASYSHPLTPVYDENGKVMGCGKKNFDENKY
jgi:hypothetical protein